MYILSKFAQKLAKNGYIARYNSIKNVPVFYEDRYDDLVESILNNETDFIPKGLEHLISQLEKNKVIIPSKEYDDAIMAAVRKIPGKPYPSVLYLMLTEKCNFACDYCFIERYMDQSKANVMSKEIAKKGIDFFVHQIKSQPDLFEYEKRIFFYGGEPLSNYDVLKYAVSLVEQYKKEGKLPEKTVLNMVTNGSFITPEVARELKEMNIGFSVSLDGISPCANSCRKYHNGKEAYPEIIEGLKNAKEAGCNCGLSITLSQEALKEAASLYELVDQYNIDSIGFNILLSDKKYYVPEQYFVDVSKFIVEAFKVFREKGIYEDRVMRKVDAFVEHRPHIFDCAAEGGNQLVIAPDGEIGLCHAYISKRETFVTNVDDMNFDIAQDPVFLEWNKRTPFNMPQCQDCMALGVCGGGCAMNAKANGKSIWDLDERFCIHAKATLEFLIWDLFEQIKKDYSEQE